MVTRMTYAFLPQISGPYVHATKHCDTLYVSGLTALGTDAQSAGLELQTRAVLQQIAAILAAEKRSTADLIKLTIFVRDLSQLALIRALLFDFYGGHLPACSLIEVSNLIHPDLLIEVESVVALG
ncbi:RidA family protein [Dickeya zeae]|nr:RidA family protein [Dickeya zeae]